MASELSNLSFTQFIQTKTIQDSVNNVLGTADRAMSFIASISAAVSVNPALKECDPHSVLSAALLGEALHLSPSPQLGQFYMVPFKDKTSIKKAQFILGYKGYLQLAIRSGQFRRITAREIKEGELKSFDPIHDKIDCVVITDPTKRILAKTVGYYGYFELMNGFEKAFYMSVEEMEHHADTYSSAFKLKDYRLLKAGKIPQADMWKYSSFWYKDFDAMARKTIVRQMLASGYAPLSTEMARAIDADDKEVQAHEDGTLDSVELMNNAKDISPEQEPGDPFNAIQSAGEYDDMGDQLDLSRL